MKSLCKECIEFFHIDVPINAFSLYDAGKCEGCWHITKTTNPNFYLLLVEKENRKINQNYASNAERKKVN